MKPKSDMIILGQIQQVTKQIVKDRKDSTKPDSVMYQLVIADKCKPSAFRTTTPFVTWMGEDKLKQRFGNPESLEDADVTLIAREVGQYNAFLKVKGDLHKGHLTGEALLRLTAETGKPESPAQPKAK